MLASWPHASSGGPAWGNTCLQPAPERSLCLTLQLKTLLGKGALGAAAIPACSLLTAHVCALPTGGDVSRAEVCLSPSA